MQSKHTDKHEKRKKNQAKESKAFGLTSLQLWEVSKSLAEK